MVKVQDENDFYDSQEISHETLFSMQIVEMLCKYRIIKYEREII